MVTKTTAMEGVLLPACKFLETLGILVKLCYLSI